MGEGRPGGHLHSVVLCARKTFCILAFFRAFVGKIHLGHLFGKTGL